MDDLVIAFSDDMRLNAVSVIQTLRLQNPNRIIDLYLGSNKKMKQIFNYADRIGAQRVILVAPDEWNEGHVRVKYLREEGRPQYNVKISEIMALENDRKSFHRVEEQV